MTLAISVGLLIGGGVYLMMRRDMLRIALGFTLLSHGVNLLILSAGGTAWRDEPFGAHTDTETVADPLPQAFVLTAIVISFSISVLMFVTAVVGRRDDRTRPKPDETDRPDRLNQAAGAGEDSRPAAESVPPGTDTGDSDAEVIR